MRGTLMNKKSKMIAACRSEEKRLLSLLDKREFGKTEINKQLISEFFSELKRLDMIPPILKDDITEITFKNKLKYMNDFREYYIDGDYFNAIGAINDFIRFSISLFEPSAKAMLLAAWKMVNENDF